MLDIIARLATISGREQLNVMDLGCGDGDVTAEILKFNGKASCCLIDISEDMVNQSKKRFAGNDNVRVLRHDLNNGLPKALLSEEYDAVVSCISIHHIDYEKRVKLYTDINRVLKSKGYFINGDMFKGNSVKLNEWEFDNWIQWMVTTSKEHLGEEHTFNEVKEKQLDSFKKMEDKPGTIWEMYRDLKAAKFNKVDCMYKLQNLGVIVAEK